MELKIYKHGGGGEGRSTPEIKGRGARSLPGVYLGGGGFGAAIGDVAINAIRFGLVFYLICHGLKGASCSRMTERVGGG